jgi:hypothetical protein
MSLLRWVLIPKTNPREADPGNPFYSRAKPAPAESVSAPSTRSTP